MEDRTRMVDLTLDCNPKEQRKEEQEYTTGYVHKTQRCKSLSKEQNAIHT